MSIPGEKIANRKTVHEGKPYEYMADDENTYKYTPLDTNHSKFFGTWSKLLRTHNRLNTEQ